jgi:hypothetical protein
MRQTGRRQASARAGSMRRARKATRTNTIGAVAVERLLYSPLSSSSKHSKLEKGPYISDGCIATLVGGHARAGDTRALRWIYARPLPGSPCGQRWRRPSGAVQAGRVTGLPRSSTGIGKSADCPSRGVKAERRSPFRPCAGLVRSGLSSRRLLLPPARRSAGSSRRWPARRRLPRWPGALRCGSVRPWRG